jgi:hypothetical protein
VCGINKSSSSLPFWVLCSHTALRARKRSSYPLLPAKSQRAVVDQDQMTQTEVQTGISSNIIRIIKSRVHKTTAAMWIGGLYWRHANRRKWEKAHCKTVREGTDLFANEMGISEQSVLIGSPSECKHSSRIETGAPFKMQCFWHLILGVGGSCTTADSVD